MDFRGGNQLGSHGVATRRALIEGEPGDRRHLNAVGFPWFKL